MKKKSAYDRLAVGERLMERRKDLGWSRSFVAEKIGIVEKYYADIERGSCGMSVETLIALVKLYGFSMDALIYGSGKGKTVRRDDILIRTLENLPDPAQDCCLKMLYLFMEGIQAGEQEHEQEQNPVLNGMKKS